MKQQRLLLRISELLSRFRVQVGILNASSMFDINIVAEDFLIPILNEIYNCNLINANTIKKNYPGVDLVDKLNKISIQVTSTSTTRKIKNTLEKIKKNKLYELYDKFYILIITEKEQKKYKDSTFTLETEGKFSFSNKNIIDISDLFIIIKSLPLKRINKIKNILVSQYTDELVTNEILKINLPTIYKLINNFDEKYLYLKLQTAYKARQGWCEKKSFLEISIVNVSDANQKFTIQKSIDECNIKIIEYEKEIINVLDITQQIENGK